MCDHGDGHFRYFQKVAPGVVSIKTLLQVRCQEEDRTAQRILKGRPEDRLAGGFPSKGSNLSPRNSLQVFQSYDQPGQLLR